MTYWTPALPRHHPVSDADILDRDHAPSSNNRLIGSDADLIKPRAAEVEASGHVRVVGALGMNLRVVGEDDLRSGRHLVAVLDLAPLQHPEDPGGPLHADGSGVRQGLCDNQPLGGDAVSVVGMGQRLVDDPLRPGPGLPESHGLQEPGTRTTPRGVGLVRVGRPTTTPPGPSLRSGEEVACVARLPVPPGVAMRPDPVETSPCS